MRATCKFARRDALAAFELHKFNAQSGRASARDNNVSTAHNDFAAVGALPWVKEVDDSVHQYSYDPINTRVEPNVPFIENWSQRTGWKASSYHLRVPDSRYLERVGRLWDMFAVSAVLRDRHFVDCWYAFVAGK